MNILDDNSENLLLEKKPYGKIFLYGIVVPIGMTFLIFYYLFDGKIGLNPIFFSLGRNSTPISQWSVLVSILSVLLFFILSSTWVRNVKCSKTLKITLQILVLFLVITSIILGINGQLINGGWTAYPPLSSLPDSDLSSRIALGTRFQNVMFVIPLIGVFSLWDISKGKR